jgi:hypothetical protein
MLPAGSPGSTNSEKALLLRNLIERVAQKETDGLTGHVRVENVRVNVGEIFALTRFHHSVATIPVQ